MAEDRKAVLVEKRDRLRGKLGVLASKARQTQDRIGQIEAEIKGIEADEAKAKAPSA